MVEVLEFVFRDFWTWLGTVILIVVTGASLNGVLTVVKTTVANAKATVVKSKKKESGE